MRPARRLAIAGVTKLNSKLAEKGTLTKEQAALNSSSTMARIAPTLDFAALADCDLIVEVETSNRPAALPLERGASGVSDK